MINNDENKNIDIDKYCSTLLSHNNNNNNNNNNTDNKDNDKSFKSFQFFIKYLYLYSNILKLNKDQLINIKKIINQFKLHELSKFVRYSEFELYIILKYPDYIKFNYDNTQIESIIIRIVNNHLSNLSNSKYLYYWKGAIYFDYIINNIINLDDSNFKINLSNKIIKIILEFIKEINRNKFYYNSLLVGLLSFNEILGIDGYKDYSNDIIDFFVTSEFSAYNRDNFEIYINQIKFLIQLINNNNNNNHIDNSQKRELLYLKLVNCGRRKVQSNSDIVNLKQIVINYFKRIEQEELNNITNSNNSSSNNITNSNNSNIQVIDKLKFIIEILVDDGSFHEKNFKLFIKDFKELLEKYYNSNSGDIDNQDTGITKQVVDKSIIKFTIKRLITLVKELPINEILQLVKQLIKVFQISKVITCSLFLKKYLVYLEIDNYIQLVNVFKINEDDIQDKEILKRSYDHTFNYLKRSSRLELSLDLIFNKQHILNSPILKEYLINKLAYLINLLSIGVIEEYILPIFNNECNGLINYKNKIIYNNSYNNKIINSTFTSSLVSTTFNSSDSSSTLTSTSTSTSTSISNSKRPTIPYYLITNILYYLINNKLIYSFEKLNLLLINKKIFEITSNIINLSTIVPLDIYYHYHSLEIQALGSWSIIKPQLVKWLKIKISNIVNSEFYILQVFKSLEILEISGYIDDQVLSKRNFKFNQSLKRIIIKCSFHDAKKSATSLTELGKHFAIELYLNDDYIPEHKIQMKMVKQLSIELNTLFKCYNDSKLSKLSQFSLIVNSINHSLAKNFNGLYIEKQKRIKHLEFNLLYNGSLDVLFNYFKNLTNLSTLSFKLNTSDINIQSVVSDIFRIFNNNSNFKQLYQIKITDQYGYTLDLNWSLINLFNYKDKDLNYITFINQNQLNQNIQYSNSDISDEDDY